MYGVNGSYIVMNTQVGFAGYDRDDNLTFYVNDDEFIMRKATIEQEITLCSKMRFIPVELYDNNNVMTNDGIGLVSLV
jgi:hypothetical protein